jgi:uracil phosphoribosyltransferase
MIDTLRYDTLRIVRHSMVGDALGVLRSRSTPIVEFRARARMIARALAYESTRELPVEPVDVETPLCTTAVDQLRARVIATPILRAGLGMLDGFLDVVPTAATGFIGLKRDEQTLLPKEYYRNYPDPTGAHFFLLDPMLATGGSVLAALRSLSFEAIASVTLLSIIAAPEGVAAVSTEFPSVRIFTASLDERLNEFGFIVPGLGDAGDRLCDTC